MNDVFRSLRVRNYRLYASGQIVSLTGTWAQRVAQDWLVLELSGDSGTALGIVVGLQFLPLLLFGLYGGVLADRYDKRRILVAAQAVMAAQALVLGTVVALGAAQLWHVYVLAAMLGTATAIEIPARQSFVVEIVGPDDLPNAISLNSAMFNTARIVGPAIAGLAIAAAGTAPVFLANAVSYLAVIGGLLALRTSELSRATRVARKRGQLVEGLRYVRGRPDLLLTLVLVGVIGMFGLNFQLTLGLMAKTEFGLGASAFGLLTSMLALGSLTGALLSARRGRPRMRMLLTAGLVFGVLEVVAGLVPSYLLLAAVLVPTGIAVLTFTTAANSTLQLRTDSEMRGRVMGLYVLVFLGGTPLGAPVVGALADAFGPRVGLLVGGSVSAASAAVIAVLLARSYGIRVRAHARPRPHLHVTPSLTAEPRSVAPEPAVSPAA